MKFDYDIAVIWAWSWGLTVSIWLASAWKKVVLIERWLIGWDCTNFGCVPSKAFIDIAKSWKYTSVKEALEKVRERRKVIQDEETIEHIEKYWMKIIKWFASFKDKNTLLIDGKNEITAKNIVLSTWSHAMTLDIEWLKKEDILTNENVFELEENINDLVVIWWGYIWSELAECFVNLWIKVSIIQRNISLIPREEEESSNLLQEVFEKKWIKIYTSSSIEKVDNKEIIICFKTWEKQKIKFDKILIALWRISNVEKLKLENVWIKYDKKWIFVDKYNRTNIKNIFAIWDLVNGNPQFTHWANNEWRGVIRNILVPFPKKSVRSISLPATLYTNLEVSRVWKTYKELIRFYPEEEIISKIIYFNSNDRSKLTNDTFWFVKINFKRLSGKILWASIFGKGAWEMLPVLTSAMDNKISAYKLSKIIFAYPTKSEIIKKVCDSFVIHTISNFKEEIKHFFKTNILQIVTFLVWFFIVGAFLCYKSLNNLSLENIAINMYNFIWKNMWIGAFLYIFIYFIRPIVFFPATLLTFMSWALFGFWWWFIFTMIWENLSAILAYFLWNIFGKKFVSWESSWVIEDIKNRANKNPFTTILMTRFLFLPFDIVNYVSWFLKIRFKSFISATIIWIIPWAAVFILAWSAFHNQELESLWDIIKNIDIKMLYFASILFIITLIIAKILKKFMKN